MSGHGGPPNIYTEAGGPPHDASRNADWGVPGSQPRAVWNQPPYPLVFSTTIDPAFGDVTGVFRRATWQTPVFDLRPDLEGSLGSYRTAKAIWPADGATLFFQFTSDGSAAEGQMNVFTLESGAITNPQRETYIARRRNITEDYYDHDTLAAQRAGVLMWAPPLGLYRFWRVTVVVDVMANLPAAPVIVAEGAMY